MVRLLDLQLVFRWGCLLGSQLGYREERWWVFLMEFRWEKPLGTRLAQQWVKRWAFLWERLLVCR